MLRLTFKIGEESFDLEFDERQKILNVLKAIYKKNNIDDKNLNKIRLEIDKRTIDIDNTFQEMNIKNNEIITILK